MALEGQPPYYKILGRTSVDIIKSGGFKLSALEIENALLKHPAVHECAVVGLPDSTYGEVVAAIVVFKHEGLHLERVPSPAGTSTSTSTNTATEAAAPSTCSEFRAADEDPANGTLGSSREIGQQAILESTFNTAAAGKSGNDTDGRALAAFCGQYLAPYQLPRLFKFVEAIPRNAMGKVNKKQLVAQLFPKQE